MICVSQYNIVEISFIVCNIKSTCWQLRYEMETTLCFKSVKISDYHQCLMLEELGSRIEIRLIKPSVLFSVNALAPRAPAA